jgi:2-polyprenyl-3-methyl-5-hydroxy-6-metoxy-1,4-benzoquinol methylase
MTLTIASDPLNFYRDQFYNDENRALVEACHRADTAYVRAHLIRQDRAHPELWDDEIFNNRFGMRIIATYLRDLPSLDVLDIACGSCQLLYALADQGHRIAGIDASAVRVGLHREQLRIVLALAEKIPIVSATFDIVVALECLEHVMDVGAVLREVVRLLRPGGIFLAQVPNGTFADGVNHVRLFDAARLRTTCERAGLTIEHLLDVPYLMHEPPNNLFVMASRPAHPSAPPTPQAAALAEVRERGALLRAAFRPPLA